MTRRYLLTTALLGALLALPAQDTPPPPLHLAVIGLTLDYLEPCDCGGQNAGGLARRAALIAELRREWPDLVLVDAGDLGQDDQRLAVTTRALAAVGVDGIALGSVDLDRWATLAPLLRERGLAASSVTPLVPGLTTEPAPPASQIVAAVGGPRLGVVSVAEGLLSGARLAAATQAELLALRGQGAAYRLLVAHLPRATAERLVDALSPEARPDVVVLATDNDQPALARRREGVTWVLLAHKGRSLATMTLAPGAEPVVRHTLVATGEREALVQGWVDSYFAALRAGQAPPPAGAASFPRPEACAKCHGAVVAAWQQHPHARAVATLEERKRDVAACLRCHDERLRRDGVRSAAGPRGVECASCHDKLAEHVARPESRPGRLACDRCHTAEHSPRWQAETYGRSVAEVCRAKAP
ncbi:MAG: hypothetical protein HZB16_15750 [Armatimonadetes bacterium]|nr:hypothetical protein [Armatimonadota bacterium]